MTYYAVQSGHKPGIYTSWTECIAQITNYDGPRFKKFATKAEAEQFVNTTPKWKSTKQFVPNTNGVPDASVTTKFEQSPITLETLLGAANFGIITEDQARKVWTFCSGCDFSEKVTSTPPPAAQPSTPPVAQPSTPPPVAQPSTSIVSKEPATPLSTPENLIAFTDGSMSPGRAGYAVVWPDHQEHNHSARILDGELTNNRAEFKAILHAIRHSFNIDEKCERTLIIYTDSMLMVNTATKWIHEWRDRGWKKADGNQVKNLDLVKELHSLLNTRPMRFMYVPAHTGGDDWKSRWNSVADELARNI